MIAAFWVSVALAAFAYAGYPIFLSIGGFLRPSDVKKRVILPTVTIITAAHNEENCMAAALENKLALDYPDELLEIIVVSDASTDRTEEIVRGFEDRGVKLLTQRTRRGKAAALNLAAVQATGEIIVFADANSLYQTDALKQLISNFADPSVGYVTGNLVYVDESGSLVGSGSSAYMRYENKLRELETRVGSIVGVDGAIDAVRASLWKPVPEHLLTDFWLPLSVVESGYRVAYEPEAMLYEASLRNVRDELKMRVRVILRSFQTLWDMKTLFNPVRFGIFSFQLFVHKLLRYAVGLLQIVALVTNAVILHEAPIYQLTMGVQALFYICAATGFVLEQFRRKVSVFYYSYYLCLLNGAALVALWKFMRGKQIVVWAPRTG